MPSSGGKTARIIRLLLIKTLRLIRRRSKETALLKLLLMNKNKVLSKETIENKIYSWEEEVSSNAVEVHVHHLRKKLGKDIVKTINKIGYILGEE